jgi:serine-type D-Ala-D-Ala carboxypeptidase
LKRIEALMHQGLRRHIFPGAVLLVGVDGKVALHQAYGMADLFSVQPMTCDTFFDLASLTKPLATVLASMVLVQQGRLALDRPCGEMLPGLFKAGKHNITPRHLLSHCSGLPAWRPYYMRLHHLKRAERPLALTKWLQDEALVFSPGEKEAYSDLGFILLQWLIEKISGQRLDRFVEQEIYRPLNLPALFFVDLYQSGATQNGFAATELCPWRNRLLCGQVHDDNAYAMGGIAGHAGLFGTARAVFDLLHTLMLADQGDAAQTVFDPAVVHTFFQRQGSFRYALGFDTPSDHGSSAGNNFPADSVGHLGYTGTSFWVHRPQRVVVILLTNRVHPSRYNMGIRAFRPQLHNAIMERC